MLPLLMQLLERWDEHIIKHALDQHHGRREQAAPPTEQDLLGYKPYQLLIKAYPKLEKQLTLAWNGDIKVRARKASEDDYIFPKLLRTDNLEKYDSTFVVNQETMQCVKELFDLFCSRFKVANKRHSGWFAY